MPTAINARIGKRRIGRFGVRASFLTAALWVIVSGLAAANEMMPGMESVVVDPGAPPMSHSGGGSFYSQDLGTILRLRYNTEGYGQHGDGHGNFNIGTMQVANFEDAIAFVDGQVNLNDVQGIGFNVGVGYRWMSFQPYASAAGRIQGVSIWADGTSTEADNFFPQLGLSYESLGDMWDLRANAYIPLGDEDQVGDFTPTGEIGFFGMSVGELTEAVVDSSFFAAEAEFARRLGTERDAWAFAGPYFLSNDDDDTVGYRAGLRGYAYPDLLVQMAVTDDDIFNTTATFSITWFVGRTRTDYRPACGVPDRFREPVMRNDYVVLAQSRIAGGNAFTDADGDALRIIHIDSNAAPGGDGSFENPYDMLTDANGAGSQTGDILFVHSQSMFTGENIILKDNQRFLGEGDGFDHMIVTSEEGPISLPESSPGARAEDQPMILAAVGDAITLADANEVANFDIDGQGVTARAIASPAGGAGNPNLHDLAIENTTGDAIFFRPRVLTDTNDIDGDGNTTEQFVRGSVTIRDVTFDSIGGDDIDIDSATTADVTSANVTLQETITIRDIVSTNGNGAGIRLANTHDGRAANIANYMNGQSGVAGSGGGNLAGDVGVLRFEGTGANRFAGDVVLTNVDIFNSESFAVDMLNVDEDSTITMSSGSSFDGGGGMAGGVRMNDVDGIFTATNTTFMNGTLQGVFLTGGSDGTITFGSGATFADFDGTTFDVDGFTGTFRADEDVTNDTGLVVSVQNLAQNDTTVTFAGDITDTGSGILINNNTDGTILFNGDLTLTTGTADAIVITNNANAVDINFGGEMDIITTSGDGFTATGGGNLTASNTNNSIMTSTGRIAEIRGMTISNAGVNFSDVTRSMAGITSAIFLEDNTRVGTTGGAILFGTPGDTAGQSGTIAGGADDAIVIDDSANVTISGIEINNVNAVSGVRVVKSNATTSTINLNDLEINGGNIGLEVIGGGTGALTMTVNDTDILTPTDVGIIFNNVDVTTTPIQLNNVAVDGNGAAATAGVRIVNSDASFTFDANSEIREVNGTAFEVSGGEGIISFAGDIINTVGRSVHVHDITGGSVNFTAASSVDDDGLGILVQDNSGGAISFLGNNDLDPLAAATEAVLVDNNTGATITFAGLNIMTATASTTRGFVAQDGGTLSVTGATNVINTENGTGLSITDMTIGSVDFQSVTVDGGTGPTNAIVLENLTGGQVEIGTTTGAQNSGGVLRSTDDAIVVTNVQNVALRDLQVLSAGAAAGDNGIAITHDATATTAMDVTIDGLNLDASGGDGVLVTSAHASNTFILRFINGDLEENFVANATGAGLFQMRVEDTTIDVGDLDAFATAISGSATNADIILRDVDFLAGDGSAVSITGSGGTLKTIDLLIDGGSTFTNSSGGNASAEFLSTGNTTFNATIQDNVFDNVNAAGSEFNFTADGASARVRLVLGGDDAALRNIADGGAGDFTLVEQNGADFDVFDRDDTFADMNNDGFVMPESPAGVANPGAFDNLPVAPTPPVIP